ncbi:ATP synthase subunit alpha [Clarias magur]|uniref:ATP synthase subunit alpha n=1 Tax=Clarias magur TaxID=1594786 RepID=A0A8J4UJM8_CLAMG|nr:ATP synthase subunit alpha [Clarias magur]
MAGLNLQTKKPTAYRSASADSLAPVSGGCLSAQTHSRLSMMEGCGEGEVPVQGALKPPG